MAEQKAKKTARKRRTPVAGNRAKLEVPENIKDPSFHYRWVNDTPGNIMRHQEAGYEVVEDEQAVIGEPGNEHSRLPESAIVKQAGRTRDQTQTATVLMRIPKEYFEEDQQLKEDEIQESERAMYQRNAGGEGFYESEHKRSRS